MLMASDATHTPSAAAAERERSLIEWFRDRGSVLVGFSGGVDSVYLAAVAVDALGSDRVLAVLGRSPSVADGQWETAVRVAEEFGIPLHVAETRELEDPNYAANPANRCYFCKAVLWTTLAPIARARGLAAIVDGTNADDAADYRPGARAASEHDVESPLALLGFRKDDIRALSRARGLPTWSQPSSPCLSSRLPYGTAVTSERLRQVDAAEQSLRALGIEGDLRVRYHGDLARVELSRAVIEAWLEPSRLARVRAAVAAAGFARVCVDLRGFRSGSLNVLEGVVHE